MLSRTLIVLAFLGTAVSGATASPAGSFVDKVIAAESSGNPHARPCDAATGRPVSSAFGAGQFIEATWLAMVRRYRPDLAARSEGEILALRGDFALSRQMTVHYAEENRLHLLREGLKPTEAALYLAHFAGPRGATSLLKAHRDSAVTDILSPQAIAANGFLRGKSVASLYAWAKAKMNVKVDPAASRGTAATASPGCGPAEAPTQVAAAAPAKEPKSQNSPASAPKQREVRLVLGGVTRIVTIN